MGGVNAENGDNIIRNIGHEACKSTITFRIAARAVTHSLSVGVPSSDSTVTLLG